MDALVELNEHFLSCNICTETYKDPCTLGCQHTFCRACLTKYTKTRRDAISAKSILCPNCNQMTKVPRDQEPVDQWCQQFKPSFLIQGLLDSFAGKAESSDPVEHCCFTCHQNEKTTQATSICEECDIIFCDACTTKHLEAPYGKGHVISPLGAASTLQPRKRKVMCHEHSCLVEFFCKDCQKAVCNKCIIFHHRRCNSVVTLDSMIPEMKQVLQQNYDDIEMYRQQTGNTLKSWRSEAREITQHKSSLRSEIRRVSQQAMDLIKRKEKKLLDELETLTEKQTEELRSQIKSGEIDMQTYQQFSEYIKQVLQSNCAMDMYDMYTLCQSGEITAEIQRPDKQGDRSKKVKFEKQMEVDQLDKTFHLGFLGFAEEGFNVQVTPKLLSSLSYRTKDDKVTVYTRDFEVLNIGQTETLVCIDKENSKVNSFYNKDDKPHYMSLKLDQEPFSLTKISQDTVAVSYFSHNSIELIKLTPDPVLTSTIKTKKKYRCLTVLSDTTLAAGSKNPPSIDVLNLSGRVLRSVIKPKTLQDLIKDPRFMCTTRQGHIVVSDKGSSSIYCVTQHGEILNTYKLTSMQGWACGITSATGSVLVADTNAAKVIQLTETVEYVRDLLTRQDGIDAPRGLRVYGNKLYVTELNSDDVKIFQS